MKAARNSNVKNAKDTLRHLESLGAVRQSHSKPRHPDLKVRFAGNSTGDNAAPSAPSKEDLVDSNDRPPKYESIHNRSEPLQGITQAPGSTSYNIPAQQVPVYTWQQQGGPFQYPTIDSMQTRNTH